ncbi:MAG TPA: hypothetical protein VM901_07785 [Bdellovibrionota bacterium]|nr:hypothetical protein [Bdellovibrionota bacterium]
MRQKVFPGTAKLTVKSVQKRLDGATLNLPNGKRVKVKAAIGPLGVNVSVVDDSSREIAHGALHLADYTDEGSLGSASMYVNETVFRANLANVFRSQVMSPATELMPAGFALKPDFADGSFELSGIRVEDSKNQVVAHFDVQESRPGPIVYVDPTSSFAQDFSKFSDTNLAPLLQKFSQSPTFILSRDRLRTTPLGWEGQGVAKSLFKLYADSVPSGTTLSLLITNQETASYLFARIREAGGNGLPEGELKSLVQQHFADTKWGHIIRDTGWELHRVKDASAPFEVELIKP